jgi:probable F420-dependent oxidoreductase
MATNDTGGLKLGLLLPHAEGRYGGGTARWSDLLAMARLAEDVGFDSLWTIDHFNLEYPDTPSQGVWECWSLLAALAATTERVELGPLVTPTSFRNPALLAKMADTVDEISDGRLILGLGAGWLESEYRAIGLPFDHRISRFEEALAIIHGLLHDGHVDFEGRYYSARDCELRPRGPRPNGPPILIGSSGDRMLRSVARYADAWNTFFSTTGNSPDGIPPLRAKVDAACQGAGRDPATLERSCAILVGFDLPGAVGHPQVKTPLTGSPEEIAEGLLGFQREGIDLVQVYLDPMTPAGVAAFAPVLEALAIAGGSG